VFAAAAECHPKLKLRWVSDNRKEFVKEAFLSAVAAESATTETATSTSAFAAAAACHPKFKLRWVSDNRKEFVKEAFLSAVAAESATTETATSTSALVQFATKDDFFDFDEPENSQLIAVNKITMECLRFLEEPCDESLEVLHQFPTVKYLFRKLNATVPSSAPVERLFSSGSLISTPRRNRLTDKRFEQLLLLKANNAV